MSDGLVFRRGDIVLLSMPLVSDPKQTKSRPAVVIQNDVGNRFSPNLIVATISSQLPKREYPTDLIIRIETPFAEGSGLDRDSVVQVEVIFTIPKGTVARRLGHFDEAAMHAIDGCLKVNLALA